MNNMEKTDDFKEKVDNESFLIKRIEDLEKANQMNLQKIKNLEIQLKKSDTDHHLRTESKNKQKCELHILIKGVKNCPYSSIY